MTGPPGADPSALSKAHTDQYRDLLDAVAEEPRPLVTAAEATSTLAVVSAIYESALSGRLAPVQDSVPDEDMRRSATCG